MRARSDKLVLLLFGCLSCLAVASIVNADGRLFVLNLENSTGSVGFREAERACASLHARLASSTELRHAVVECFFSTCTRGWLYGGTVGTTVCNVGGGVLKAVDVRTENATEGAANLNAFCIKDRGIPCGDPPSFPNARLQGHSGYEMGDELLYTCVPGYAMPSGHKAFSLLCDSCGEWYGMVETCVRDEVEGHVDYEDKFPDTYRGEDREQREVEAHGEVQEKVHEAARADEELSQRHQETTFSVEEEERAIGDFIGHPLSEQQPGVTAGAATEAPVSLLSQKHMFWFPSEAFHDEVTQRDSTIQSEESKENDSQEINHSQKPIEPDDLDQGSDHYVHHDTDDEDDHSDDHHDADDERDTHQDYGDHDDHPKPQHEDLDRLDHPTNQDNRDDHYDMGEHDEDHGQIRYDGHDYDDQDDAYNERDSYEDREDVTVDRGDEDQEHLDDSQEHPDHDDNEDRDDDEHHYNQEEDDNDHYTNADDRDDGHDDHDDDHNDHDVDHNDHDDDHNNHDDDHNDHDDDHDEQHPYDDDDDDHDDHDDPVNDHHDDEDLSDDHPDNDHDDDDHHDDQRLHDDDIDPIDHTDKNDADQDGHRDRDEDHNSHEDHDSEDNKDSGYHVIFSITRDHHQNITEMADGGTATTDETWLDGYPVVETETENRDSRSKDEERDTGVFNEVESQKPISHASLPEESKSPSKEPVLEQAGGQKMWPGFIPTATPTLDSYREQAPTYSWINDLTQQSSINRDPAPPGHDSNAVMEEHTRHNLPGESGDRSEMEGEMGETGCTGENCPPPASSGQSPKVAAIIVVVCLVAIAVMVGVWCYRRQQQKSSVYEMNGKGQSQSRPAQQMEMQQKV